MPIYEYVCLDCGTHFEALRLMRDADAPIACAGCQSDHTSRQLAVAFACGGQSSAGGSVGASTGSGCGGCRGGSCASCGH